MTDTTIQQENASPALWNPNAAACWCLLFSPVFGAYLHAQNWVALGEPDKAARSILWFKASIAMFAVIILVGLFANNETAVDGFSRLLTFSFLLAWYFTSAKAQVAYIKEKFGDSYVRRPWGRILLIALGIFLGCMFAVGVLAFIVALFSAPVASAGSGM